MTDLQVINHTRSLEGPLQVKNCESFTCRLKGLMFRKQIDPGDGLLLVHKQASRSNAAIHMLFVGMDLGVVWLDDNRIIVDRQLAESWKPFYTPSAPARYILEVHPDRLAEFEIGDKLSFE
ncbi:MAG: DUF192 domain-containing protein [Anaerolineales bacterium]|jgi:uncharacterized membrane protein (UPF0127 family)